MRRMMMIVAFALLVGSLPSGGLFSMQAATADAENLKQRFTAALRILRD